MKVYEILEKKQLNEALPLIGGIGLGGILTAISVGIAAWSAYDIYNFIKKYNEDPEQITEEEWDDLFLDAVLLFTPAFLKIGKAGLAKIIPDSWKRKGGKWLRNKITGRYKEVMAKKAARGQYPITGLSGKARYEMIAKRAAASAEAGAAASKGLAKISGASALIQGLGITVIIGNYLRQIWSVEADFEEFKAAKEDGKEITNTDNIFINEVSVQSARDKALEIREELLGYTTAQILAVTGFLGKFVSLIGSAIKIVPVFGFLIGSPLRGLGWVLNLGGNSAAAAAARTALTAWISTPAGLQFVNKWTDGWLIMLGSLVTKWLGEATAIAIDGLQDLGDAAAKWVSEKTGIAIKVPDAVKSKIRPETDDEKAADDARNPSNAPTLNGIRLTGSDGFLRTDRDFYNNGKIRFEVGKAIRSGKPNPLDAVPKKPESQLKPGERYPTGFNSTSDQFIF